MRNTFLAALLLLAGPAWAQGKPAAHSPTQIVADAPKSDWLAIAPSDLLVMDLAPDARGKARRVVIQLMPAPFSQGWVGNVRTLAAARFWDGLSVYRVQDNYVAQWGDAEGEDAKKAKALPAGLAVVPEATYSTPRERVLLARSDGSRVDPPARWQVLAKPLADPYSREAGVTASGWPVASDGNALWPVHCYGMVGVARNLSPDTGTGAELYAVIGHAPRQLDRNIALVGRVIEGIEHLSSLPRGTGASGFYEKAEERTPIRSVRSGEAVGDLPAYEVLSTESDRFSRYAEARANRRDPFFIVPAGGADVCNVPVPVRRVAPLSH